MHQLQVVHKDVKIRLFYFSLEGISRDWYQSLPIASISILVDFHATFHVFCKGIFSANFLFPECCHEFNLLYKDPNICEEFATTEDTLHYDQEINNPHYDNLSDAFDIASNTSTIFGCHEDHIFPVEDLKGDEPMHISADRRNESEPARESNRSTYFRSLANTMSSPQLSDL